MSASVRFDYPGSGVSSTNWQASAGPVLGSTGIDVASGIAAATMSDDVTTYAYRFADKKNKYVLAFNNLTLANWQALEAFLDLVEGDYFSYTDGTCGPLTDTRIVQLAPESYQRSMRLTGRGRVSITVALIDG